MTQLSFVLPPSQQRMPVIGAVVLFVIAIVAGIIHVYYFTGLAGLCGIVLLLTWLLVMLGSSTELDERGIRTKRGVFRDEVAWEDVRDVKLDPKSGEVVMVFRREGKPFKLGAPANATLSRDPQYRAKVEQVLQFARAHVR